MMQDKCISTENVALSIDTIVTDGKESIKVRTQGESRMRMSDE